MKHIKKFESVESSGISTNSVWVVVTPDVTSIDRIFLSENEARMAAESENIKFGPRSKFRHMTLESAIEEIKDNIGIVDLERELPYEDEDGDGDEDY